MIVVGIGYAPSESANPMRPMTHFGVLRRAVDFTPSDLPLQRPPDRGTICRVRAIERVPPAKQQSPSSAALQADQDLLECFCTENEKSIQHFQ